MANLKLRLAEQTDAKAVADIYRTYVEKTTLTFETRALSEAAMAEKIKNFGAVYPFLVCEQGDAVVGFAYAMRHMEQPAFDYNAVIVMYVDPSVCGRGIGRALYDALEGLLRAMGVINLYSKVVTPNPKGQHLHMAMGYMEAGRLRETGFKAGRWRDLISYEKSLALHDQNPKPIRPVRELGDAKIQECLRHGEELFRR